MSSCIYSAVKNIMIVRHYSCVRSSIIIIPSIRLLLPVHQFQTDSVGREGRLEDRWCLKLTQPLVQSYLVADFFFLKDCLKSMTHRHLRRVVIFLGGALLGLYCSCLQFLLLSGASCLQSILKLVKNIIRWTEVS